MVRGTCHCSMAHSQSREEPTRRDVIVSSAFLAQQCRCFAGDARAVGAIHQPTDDVINCVQI